MNAEVERIKEIPEYKLELVKELANKIKSSKTVLIASTKGLPSSQFHSIKKKMRGSADVKVARKSAVLRAIDDSKMEGIASLKDNIGSDVALFFSDLDPFALSGLLIDNESEAKAKAGDTAPFDIIVEPGPTELIPGPAISELGSVGLKVAVENGKLAIKSQTTVAKEGAIVDEKLASVLGKLNISPMKVGFLPEAAYSSEDKKVYVGIKIDKAGALELLQECAGKSLSFAVNIVYPTEKTIGALIGKAGMHEMALIAKAESNIAVEEKPADAAESSSAEPATDGAVEGEVKEEKKDE
jgi:large subunit ribosomal protein L10